MADRIFRGRGSVDYGAVTCTTCGTPVLHCCLSNTPCANMSLQSARPTLSVKQNGVCALASALLACGALVEPRAVPTGPLSVNADAVAIGQVTTLAGSGIAGYRDDAVDVAQFNHPTAASATNDGRIFVGEYSNHALRMITGNVVSTLAGLADQAGQVDGPGPVARFDSLRTLTLDSDGNAYGCGSMATREFA